MLYTRRPQVFEAYQWWKNGDHPFDQAEPGEEGRYVRYFRDPAIKGTDRCNCGHVFNNHGWIDQPLKKEMVCPGNWIMHHNAAIVEIFSNEEFRACFSAIDPYITSRHVVDYAQAVTARYNELLGSQNKKWDRLFEMLLPVLGDDVSAANGESWEHCIKRLVEHRVKTR